MNNSPIVTHTKTIFSRFQVKTDENEWLYATAYSMAKSMKSLFMDKFAVELEWWDKWHTLELIQSRERIILALVEYESFGVHPFPKAKRSFVYCPIRADILELEIKDPFLLQESYKLIPKKGMGATDPLRNGKDRARWFTYCIELYKQFEDLNLLSLPEIYRKSSFQELLALKQVEIIDLPRPDAPSVASIKPWRFTPIQNSIVGDFSDL